MPKITKQRKHTQAFHPYRSNKAEDKDVSGAVNTGEVSTEPASSTLSRGQKKRLEKKEHIMQKIGLKAPQFKNSQPATADAKDSTTKSMKQDLHSEKTPQALLLSTLDEMECENDVDAEERERFIAQAQLTTNKLKKEVAIREANRIKLVQQHPLFQENPLDAIQKHLQQITGKSLAEVTALSANKAKK